MALSVQNGYVVYTRGSKSHLWDKIHREAVAASGSFTNILGNTKKDRFAQAGERLIGLADVEQQKEMALLQKAGFEVTDPQDIKTFISKFNEILMSKQQFQYALNRLELALSKENQSTDKRAPSITVWFTSYLRSNLSKNITDFANQNIAALNKQDFSAWTAQIDAIIDTSIKEAFEQMLTKAKAEKGKELYGDASQWEAVFEASRLIKDFDTYFGQMIRSKIDFSQLNQLFQDAALKIKRKDRRYGNISKAVENRLNLSNGRKARSIGGSVEEYVMQIVNSMGAAFQSAASSSGAVFTSETMKTDTVTIYSYKNTLDVSKGAEAIVNSLNETMMGSESLLDATNRMKQFYQETLSNLDETFIVYGSTKLYSMSESFTRGFHGGGERSLEDAIRIISQAGLASGQAAENFIKAAYNTGEGAIYASHKTEAIEGLKAGLMGVISELLFDDWVSIGETSGGGAQAIHVLQLEGLQIPSSVFLRATGKAMIELSTDMERYVKIHVNLPGEIKYPEHNPIKEHRYEEVLARWEEQAAIAQEQSSFSMSFLLNFKSIITQWINF